VITFVGWLWLTEARGLSQKAHPCPRPPTLDSVSRSHALLPPPAPTTALTDSHAALAGLRTTLTGLGATLTQLPGPPPPRSNRRRKPVVLLYPCQALCARPPSLDIAITAWVPEAASCSSSRCRRVPRPPLPRHLASTTPLLVLPERRHLLPNS
jgi:hypothetical protein